MEPGSSTGSEAHFLRHEGFGSTEILGKADTENAAMFEQQKIDLGDVSKTHRWMKWGTTDGSKGLSSKSSSDLLIAKCDTPAAEAVPSKELSIGIVLCSVNSANTEQHSHRTFTVEPSVCSPSTTRSTGGCRGSARPALNRGVETPKTQTGTRIYKKPELETLMSSVLKNEIPDVTVTIGEWCFKCHWGAVFSLPPEEVSPLAFTTIYSWMVEKKPQLQREGILAVLKAAKYLEVYELAFRIWDLLEKSELHDDHAFSLYFEACQLQMPDVCKATLGHISKFFLTLVSSSDFDAMSAENVCHLFESNKIAVNSEIEVLMSAVKWLSHKWEERRQLAMKILRAVRFSLMPPWFLALLVNDKCDSAEMRCVLNNPEVDSLITDALSDIWAMYNMQCLPTRPKSASLRLVPQRVWIYDVNCVYHTRDNNIIETVSYENFLKYLDFLSTTPLDYFKQVTELPGHKV